jgi:hypothetical protein
MEPLRVERGIASGTAGFPRPIFPVSPKVPLIIQPPLALSPPPVRGSIGRCRQCGQCPYRGAQDTYRAPLRRAPPPPRTQPPPGIQSSTGGRRLRRPGAFQPASLPPSGQSPGNAVHPGKTLSLIGGQSQGLKVAVSSQSSAVSHEQWALRPCTAQPAGFPSENQAVNTKLVSGDFLPVPSGGRRRAVETALRRVVNGPIRGRGRLRTPSQQRREGMSLALDRSVILYYLASTVTKEDRCNCMWMITARSRSAVN